MLVLGNRCELSDFLDGGRPPRWVPQGPLNSSLKFQLKKNRFFRHTLTYKLVRELRSEGYVHAAR